jgi:hypothetical protein
MRFIWQPQPQAVLSGSCAISTRGRCAGSAVRRGLALGVSAVSACSARRCWAQCLEFGLQCGQVGIQGLVEQAALVGMQLLALGRKLQALVAGNLVREQVDLGLLEVDLLILAEQASC